MGDSLEAQYIGLAWMAYFHSIHFPHLPKLISNSISEACPFLHHSACPSFPGLGFHASNYEVLNSTLFCAWQVHSFFSTDTPSTLQKLWLSPSPLTLYLATLLPHCPREVWERAGESLLVTSQLTVKSMTDRAENTWGLGWYRSKDQHLQVPWQEQNPYHLLCTCCGLLSISSIPRCFCQ